MWTKHNMLQVQSGDRQHLPWTADQTERSSTQFETTVLNKTLSTPSDQTLPSKIMVRPTHVVPKNFVVFSNPQGIVMGPSLRALDTQSNGFEFFTAQKKYLI